MQHFQSILIVVGLLAVVGVLIHGYLLSRKEKLSLSDATNNVDLFAEKNSPALDTLSVNDEISNVISDVRIISSEVEADEETIDFSLATNHAQITPVEFSESSVEITTQEDEVLVVGSQIETPTSEPLLSHRDSQIDNDNDSDSDADSKVEQPQDLFIFNVVAKEDTQLGGHELLQFFLTSGFRFGEMSIFHRHQHSNGTGPVLFSIANMMAPGVFDPENMEQFKSEGVSFFLSAPNIDIDIKTSFELMLRAVEQMAAEFDCLVLNAAREPMTQEQFIEYNHRLLHYI